MLKKIIIPGLLLLTFSACKKDNSCDKTVASIAGTYSLVKLEVGSGGVFSDITGLLETCQLDDKLSLNANGTSSYMDLGTVCLPAGDESGTWDITAAGKMTINTGGGTVDVTDADITSFDCSTLVLTGFDLSSPGDQFRLTIRK